MSNFQIKLDLLCAQDVRLPQQHTVTGMTYACFSMQAFKI